MTAQTTNRHGSRQFSRVKPAIKKNPYFFVLDNISSIQTTRALCRCTLTKKFSGNPSSVTSSSSTPNQHNHKRHGGAPSSALIPLANSATTLTTATTTTSTTSMSQALALTMTHRVWCRTAPLVFFSLASNARAGGQVQTALGCLLKHPAYANRRPDGSEVLCAFRKRLVCTTPHRPSATS